MLPINWYQAFILVDNDFILVDNDLILVDKALILWKVFLINYIYLVLENYLNINNKYIG